jgi:hypothetical protein
VKEEDRKASFVRLCLRRAWRRRLIDQRCDDTARFRASELDADIEMVADYLGRHQMGCVSDLVGSIDTTSREKEWISS